jgi:RNA polymerase sigma-70 factor (ECF subfamily)
VDRPHSDLGAEELTALRRRLLRAAAKLARTRQEREDLVQSAFERCWKSRRHTLQGSELERMLLTIVKRLAIDGARRRGRWRTFELHEEMLSGQPAEDTPRSQVVAPERLQAALERCAPRERQLLSLHYLDGLGYLDIARRLQLPPGTVATCMRRARHRLRRLLVHELAPPAPE